MTVESAVFIDDPSALSTLDDGYDRVYFGNEFCDKRIPSHEEVRAVYDYCSDNDLDMTLVTPILTPTKVPVLSELFDTLRPIASDLELVFNDWGVYRLAAEQGTFRSLVAGRTLSQQKRDSTVSHLSGDSSVELRDGGESVTDEAVEHFTKSIVNVPYARQHLRELGVERVEIDVLPQGVFDEELEFSASIYYPWNYVTVKRWCEESQSVPLCNRDCDENVYSLDSRPVIPQLLYRKNNVIFMKNETVPELDYVDRMVYLPTPVN